MGWRSGETFFYNGKNSRKFYFPAIKEARTVFWQITKRKLASFKQKKRIFAKKYLQ